MEATITSFERKDQGFLATIQAGGYTLCLSQRTAEDKWYVDALFTTSNSYPHFCHGNFSRACKKQYVKDSEVHALLEKEKAQCTLTKDS